MPWPVPASERRSPEELRHHYEIESALARELRRASAPERRLLYGQVYDRLFAELPALARRPDPRARAHEIEIQARALAPYLHPDDSFAEFGAGDCALSLRIAGEVGQVVAIDASTAAAPKLEAPANFERITSGDTHLGLDDRSVDLAYSCHFIEHLHPEDALEHVSEVRRVLRPEGCYVCITPNRLWGPHDISRFFDEEPQGLHLKEYSYRDLIGLLRGAGFQRIAALKAVSRPPELVAATLGVALEAVLEAIPTRPRRWLMASMLAGRASPPFRPLEQVALAARP